MDLVELGRTHQGLSGFRILSFWQIPTSRDKYNEALIRNFSLILEMFAKLPLKQELPNNDPWTLWPKLFSITEQPLIVLQPSTELPAGANPPCHTWVHRSGKFETRLHQITK